MATRPVARSALVAFLLVAATAAFAAPVAADTIDVATTLGHGDADSEVDARTQLDVPDGVVDLEVTVPEGSDVYETDGFDRTGDRTYEWTRETDEPSLRYTLEGNVTAEGRDGLMYAKTAEWGVVRTPNVGLSWTGTRADVDRSHDVDGEGVAGSHITYLGPSDEHVREASDQRIKLVVPAAAELRDDPEEVLDSLEYASERLDVDEADEEVLVIAAPTAGVTWGASGLHRGDADLWVRDVEPLDTPRNIWVHEYVHSRQDYDRTAETEWTVEGMADYYATLLPYEEGRIDYDAFRDRMAAGRGDEYDDVRLSDPDTWRGSEAHYDRGALVFGYLDRRLRAEADSSIDAVVAAMNEEDDELTQERFLELVEASGDGDVRDAAERYTETTEAPDVWSRQEHVEAFGGPDFRYTFERFEVTGPYREATLEDPRLVPGETLTATVRVENVGTQEGDYDARFDVDGDTLGEESGTLAAGEETALTFSHEFDATGEFDLLAGTAVETATVEEPADAEVVGLAVDPTEAARGEAVTLRATVNSTADRPVDDEVTFTADGESVATERVRADAGRSTVETTVTFDRAGEYELAAGNRTASLTVTDETATTDERAGPGPDESADDDSGVPTPGDGGGFGAPAAAVALAVALVVARFESGRP